MNIIGLLLLSLLLSYTFGQTFTANFALSWLSGFCQTEAQTGKELCQPSLVALWDNQSHTIHGLWPEVTSPQSFGGFNIQLFEKNLRLLDDMHNYWPPKTKNSTTNVFLWDHQWTTHGQDYAYVIYKLRPEDFPGSQVERNNALQLAFFQDIINLYKSLKAKKLPVGNFTKSQFASQLGLSEKQINFFCYKENLVREVRVCYSITKQGLSPIDCKKFGTTCANGAATIRLPNWSPKPQTRVYDYPKMQESQQQSNLMTDQPNNDWMQDCLNEINILDVWWIKIIAMGLNNVIEERIGLGPFQIRAFLVLCLIDMNDGVELVLSSFLNPIIREVFPHSTTSFISAVASVFYIGILFGSMISGHLADRYGRRVIIRFGAVMQICVSLLFYFANSLTLMLLLRLLYGFSFGYTVAITTSMFAQITPQKQRGKGILLINFCISLGKLYGVFLGYVFIQENLAATNWKLMMICGTFPNVIVLLGSQLVLTESPRWLLAHKQFQAGIEVLNIMILANKGHEEPLLSLEEQEQIREEFSIEQEEDHQPMWVLFNEENLKTTAGLCLCWLILNFCYYGQLTVEALHISGPKMHIREGLSRYFLTVFGQMPSLFLTMFMIDHPLFGRKNSLVIFFLAAGIFHLIFGLTAVTIIGSVARFFMKDVFQVIYPLTTESFETRIRTKGFGFCSGFGRVGAILMPFILIPLDEWKQSSVYVIFAVISGIAGLIAWKMILETMNKNLDKTKESKLMGVMSSYEAD